MDITYMESAEAFRAWLAENHATATELWVGFYNKASGRPSITYPESVDEALCYGWIDGLRKNVDATSYKIRFTPRKRTSIWSAVNIKRVEELIALRRVQPPGLAAFEARDPARTNRYSFEQEGGGLDPTLEAQFQANDAAWTFFQAQTASYRRTAMWWVMSAKKDETRQKRLSVLMESSEKHERLPQLTSPVAPHKQTKHDSH
ncbi:MAG: YdeI/OmpD-associated family protein [Anaerolineae bacterium]